MSKILSAPGKFIIGNGEIAKLNDYVSDYGSPLLVVAHKEDAERVKDSLDKVVATGVELIYGNFAGEATRAEVTRLQNLCKEKECTAVVGLGGGKALDTAKLVAHESEVPSIVVPTIASTDAPCSKMAVLYTEEHVYEDTVVFPNNPDIVLVDSGVIAKAPEHFLVAGMGDAFATYYEARACMRSGSLNYNGGLLTNAAYAMAELCNKILITEGHRALLACQQNLVTPALENIIEANILLSGVGFESCGLAVAHSIAAGLTFFPESRSKMHGEAVAFGVLVQLIMENASEEEFSEVLSFYKTVGLPMSLKDVGLTEVDHDKLQEMSERLVDSPTASVHNMPFKVDANMIYNAFLAVDTLANLQA